MSAALKLALYYPWVYTRGGAERTLVELMSRSRHEWTLYTNRFEPDATFPQFEGLNVVRLKQVSVRRNIRSVAGAALTLLTQSVDLSHHDALFVVSEGLGNLVALRSSIPTSCICLTPLKVAYDSVTRDNFYRGRRLPHYRLAIAAYCRFERPIWRRYRKVLCNSEEVRRRVLEANLVDDERLEVVHHGVDLDLFAPSNRRDRFFLLPGRIMWQKNIDLALAAWRIFKISPHDSDWRLVVAGMVDEKSTPHMARLRASMRDRPDVDFVESPSDETLIALYQRSMGILFPAQNEDWGLVPLEAMSCGKPVIAVNRGGPTESVIDGHTGYLVPDRAPEFAAAIAKLARASSAELDAFAVQARARAATFSWARFVTRIDAHAEEMAGMWPVSSRPAEGVDGVVEALGSA